MTLSFRLSSKKKRISIYYNRTLWTFNDI